MISLLSSHLLCAFLLSALVSSNAQEQISLTPDRETVYSGPHYVDEGSGFTITCYTTKFKNPSWTKDGVPISESGIEIKNSTQTKPGADGVSVVRLYVEHAKKNHAGFYKCHSQAKEEHEIVIITGIVSNEANPGEGVVVELWKPFWLHCNVTTEPQENELKIEWLRNGDVVSKNDRFTVHDNNNTLQVPNTTEAECGKYVCRIATSSNESAMSQEIMVNMKPYIKKLPKSINKVEGETVSIKCEAFGYPEPTLIWYREDKPIDPTNDRFKVPNGIKGNESTLTISDLKEDDRAEYTCSAVNEVGSYNETVLIRVKDKLAALWPFLGIVAEVAVLCTIIFIYEKRRTKQEFDESDTDQSPDTKNVTENKDKDVRQRK